MLPEIQAEALAVANRYVRDPAGSPSVDERPEAGLSVETPIVCLVTPHYGQCSMGYVVSIETARRTPGMLRMTPTLRCNSSLLPTSFNEGLAFALELRDRGQATHIAMLHSDIAAEPGWLEALYGELWFHNADLMSVVVPIKNDDGRTSTAIGPADDRWKIRRCIFMRELESLPITFGPEAVCEEGEVLLVNTGCWIADLRRSWWDDFAFNIHSRIIREPVHQMNGDGMTSAGIGYRVETRSEDWEMSHHLAEHGARVMATRRVRLRHEGLSSWPNYTV